MRTCWMRVAIAVLVPLFLCVVSLAQKDNAADAQQSAQEAFVIEQSATRVHFENDGSGSREVSAVIRIQSEVGVQEFGQLVFGYSSATEQLNVEYVRVRKPDGRTVETPGATAQDFAPEVIKAVPMYSDYRERHITVMGLRPGDLLEYRTTTRIVTPIIRGEFWEEYSFPKNARTNEARLEIEIPASREVKLKSPKLQYETVDVAGYRSYRWVVKNIVPDRTDFDADEHDDDPAPEVQLTSFRDWKQVAQWYGKLQGEQVVVNDAIRQKAAELTRGATTPVEKMRRIYGYVAKSHRYVSLSFGVGRYQPHSAPQTLQNGFGDCKDKHTLLSALLRAAGVESYPALINSSRKIDPDVPSPAQFDHVITAVPSGNGLVWLDSTTGVAPFGLIAYPLRNKQALISSQDENAGLRLTPASSPVKNLLLFSVDGKLTSAGAYDATIDITASGDSDLPLRLAFRSIAEPEWKDLVKILSLQWGLRGDVSEITVDPVEDTSKPFHLRYRYHADNYVAVPNPDAKLLAFPPLSFPALRKKKGTEPIDLGPSGEISQHTRLQFADTYKVSLPLQVDVVRDYGEYHSTYKMQGQVLDADRRLSIKMSELPAIRRADAESLFSVANNNVTQLISCVITAPTRTEKPVVATDMKPAELHKAGVKALNQGDFKSAAELLQQFVEHEAKDSAAWDELGRAYLGINKHSEALAAFQKQVEVNPFHERGYADLGAELQRSGKLEEAVTAFRKQLENNPGSKAARKSLGVLLLRLNRYQDARSELEAAASLPPGDVEVVIALAQVYAKTGDVEKGRSLLQAVLGSATPFSSADVYSAALREGIDADQTITDSQKVLDDIAEQFDSGAYRQMEPTALAAMPFIALEWARIGWAKFLKGDSLQAMRYLDASWRLTQSGTVANRLARVYEAAGQRVNAQHMLALAVAAGGAETSSSRERLAKAVNDTAAMERSISEARTELLRNANIKVPSRSAKTLQAEFLLEFDGSSKPQMAELQNGNAELREKISSVLQPDYPVAFPDYSSLKVLRKAVLSCDPAGCSARVQPIGELHNLLEDENVTGAGK